MVAFSIVILKFLVMFWYSFIYFPHCFKNIPVKNRSPALMIETYLWIGCFKKLAQAQRLCKWNPFGVPWDRGSSTRKKFVVFVCRTPLIFKNSSLNAFGGYVFLWFRLVVHLPKRFFVALSFRRTFWAVKFWQPFWRILRASWFFERVWGSFTCPRTRTAFVWQHEPW